MRYAVILLLVLAACAAWAGPQYVDYVFAPNGTNWAATYTLTRNFQGYVDEIYVEVPSLSTALVTVVSTPNVSSNMVATCLYTNAALTANAVARPRVTPTNAGGTANTNFPVESFLCAGDPVTVSVTQASKVTAAVYRVYLKITDR